MPMKAHLIMFNFFYHIVLCKACLQCPDTVLWVTGSASSIKPVEKCWYVGGVDLTGALHIIEFWLSLLPLPSSLVAVKSRMV